MPHPFFSGPAFGWSFYAVLVALTVVAAWIDQRQAVVPKWLTLTLLALGLAFNVVRGCLLGAAGAPLWALPDGGALLGGLDGLLLSLSGFLAGFALFFVMWILGTCGGGDVKLMAAVGSWVGPVLVVLLMLGSIPVLLLLVVFRVLLGSPNPSAVRARLKSLPSAGGSRKQDPKQMRLTYSLPVAVATAVLLLWFFRADLGLLPPQAPPVPETAHAR